MRPKQFVIEIPHRPIYEPGSGPAMAPITLQPDNTDTGWVIAGTVEFQGVSQYVVTPEDNPAHRRPVKKEHILDWVSPKAYEDFEYAQYKKEAEEEWERDNQLLAKAAAIKGRRHGMAVAREKAKARRSFSGYMQLGPAEFPDETEHSSSPDEIPLGVLPGRKESTKRKRSVGSTQGRESSVKRRGQSSSCSTSLQQKTSPAKPGYKQRLERTEVEDDRKSEDEKAPSSTRNEPDRPRRFETPIYPPQRFPHSSRNGSTSGNNYLSLHSSLARSIISTISPAKTAPKPNWTDLGPMANDHFQDTRLATPKDALTGQFPRDVSAILLKNSSKEYPPILPPPSPLRPSVFTPTSANVRMAGNGVGKSSKLGSLKRNFFSPSDSDESPSVAENLEVLGASITGNAEPFRDNKFANGACPSRLSSSRGRSISDKNGTQIREKKKGSRSSSSRSAAALKPSTKRKGPKVSKEQSEYFANMMMKQEEKEDEVGKEEEEDQVWDIHGILDDEWRRVGGTLVRYYLCEWVGDYDPTWEPEENISADAIKTYEKKLKRESSQGFDGTIDEYTESKIGLAWHPKSLQRFGEIAARENGNKGSDSEPLADALMDAPDEGNSMYVRDPKS